MPFGPQRSQRSGIFPAGGMQDDISQAVLEREEVVKYLHSGHGGESSARALERVSEYLDELRTTQRYGMYRALQHPRTRLRLRVSVH